MLQSREEHMSSLHGVQMCVCVCLCYCDDITRTDSVCVHECVYVFVCLHARSHLSSSVKSDTDIFNP